MPRPDVVLPVIVMLPPASEPVVMVLAPPGSGDAGGAGVCTQVGCAVVPPELPGRPGRPPLGRLGRPPLGRPGRPPLGKPGRPPLGKPPLGLLKHSSAPLLLLALTEPPKPATVRLPPPCADTGSGDDGGAGVCTQVGCAVVPPELPGRPGRPPLGRPPLGRLGRPPLGRPGKPPLGRPGRPPLGRLGRPPLGRPPLGRLGRPPLGRPPLGRLGRPPLGRLGRPPLGLLKHSSAPLLLLALTEPPKPPTVRLPPPCADTGSGDDGGAGVCTQACDGTGDVADTVAAVNGAAANAPPAKRAIAAAPVLPASTLAPRFIEAMSLTSFRPVPPEASGRTPPVTSAPGVGRTASGRVENCREGQTLRLTTQIDGDPTHRLRARCTQQADPDVRAFEALVGPLPRARRPPVRPAAGWALRGAWATTMTEHATRGRLGVDGAWR